jgi:hypothetical protein
MPRWLVSTIIVLGFFALIGLAFLPRNVTVNIEIIDQSEVHHHPKAPHAPAEGPVSPDGG